MPYITELNKPARLKTLKNQIQYLKQQYSQNRVFDIEHNPNISLYDIEGLDKELKLYEKIESMLEKC